jgi:hypothetical protein
MKNTTVTTVTYNNNNNKITISLKEMADLLTARLRNFWLANEKDISSNEHLKKSLKNLGHEVTMLASGSRVQAVAFQSPRGSVPQTWIRVVKARQSSSARTSQRAAKNANQYIS